MSIAIKPAFWCDTSSYRSISRESLRAIRYQFLKQELARYPLRVIFSVNGTLVMNDIAEYHYDLATWLHVARVGEGGGRMFLRLDGCQALTLAGNNDSGFFETKIGGLTWQDFANCIGAFTAVNSLGLVSSFKSAMEYVSQQMYVIDTHHDDVDRELNGTKFRNTHPITAVYAHAINSLAGGDMLMNGNRYDMVIASCMMHAYGLGAPMADVIRMSNDTGVSVPAAILLFEKNTA
jgi:hypothetical protein